MLVWHHSQKDRIRLHTSLEACLYIATNHTVIFCFYLLVRKGRTGFKMVSKNIEFSVFLNGFVIIVIGQPCLHSYKMYAQNSLFIAFLMRVK